MGRIAGIQIKNYGSLKNIKLGKLLGDNSGRELTNMNAIIGQSGTGKSTLADAFGCVHGGTAADGHDAVCFGSLESGHTVLHIGNGGVGLDLAVDGVGEVCSIQQVRDLLGDAELDQVGVRADEGLFVAAGGELRHNVLDGTMAMVGNGIQNDAISHKSNPPNSFAPPVPAAVLCLSE